MYKYLILLLIFLSNTAHGGEPIDSSDEEIRDVFLKIVFYRTQKEMVDKWNELYPDDKEDDSLQGFSVCSRFLKSDYPGELANDYAECTVYQMRPIVVDGEHTTTLGHEVLHGVYGTEYHE